VNNYEDADLLKAIGKKTDYYAGGPLFDEDHEK